MAEELFHDELQIHDISRGGDDSLKLVTYIGADLAAVYNYVEVTQPEGEDEIFALIKSKKREGTSTFLGRVTVEVKYSGQGIGLRMLLAAQKLLLSKHSSVIEMVVDDSVSPSSKSPTGWTERQIPKKMETARSNGYNSQIIFQGEVDGKPTWLIEYSRATTK